MSFHTKILPIIVLYQQKLDKAFSVNTLNEYLERRGWSMDLFVYDNSPEPAYDENFTFGNFNVHYVHDPSNAGVSKAYNAGALHACELNMVWILLLDQDTTFPENFLEVYETAVASHPDAMIFAPVLKTQHGDILSPCRYDHKRGTWLKEAHEGFWDAERYSPVNSGMLINLDGFYEAGGYNEAVRLDFADFQFIERYQKKYKTFYLLNLIANQNFSGYDTDINKLKRRFVFFCEGARNCERKTFSDRWWYTVAALRRMTGLIIKTKNLSFAGIFIKKYVL